MATKKKATKANPNSIFWHPQKKGETKEGKFIRFEKSTTYKQLVLALEGSKVSLGCVLQQLFTPVYSKMKTGMTVKLRYDGNSKRTKLFTVWLNGKELEKVNSFNIPASKEDMKSFFESTK